MPVAEMTKEERVICALSREEPDRVPIYDLVDNRGVIEHYAGRELTLENAQEVVPAALAHVLDTTRVWLPAAPGRRTDRQGFVYERVDWWNEWQVDTPFHDERTLVEFVERDIAELDGWKPGNANLEGFAANEWPDALAAAMAWKARWGGVAIPGSTAGEALSGAWIPLGLDRYVYLEAEHPALVRRWLAALHARTMRRLSSESSLIAVSRIAWIFDDVAFKGHLMFSPDYMREHGVFRHIGEMCDVYHSQGFKIIFHSDGEITPIVPDLIDSGVDAIAPVDIPAGMDLALLKERFGKRVGFVGGIDLEVLTSGTVEDVRRLTLSALRTMGPGGGFVLGSSSEELYDVLPKENIIAMWETALEAGRYPLA
jgi:hypothetical protein